MPQTNTSIVDISLVKAVASYIIPLISVALSYVFGRLESKTSSKQVARMERYTNFYVPYVKKLYAGFAWDYPIGKQSFEARCAILDLLMNNLQYLDVKTQRLIPDFYAAFLDMAEYNSGNPAFQNAPEAFESCFWSITQAVLLESSRLSRKLKLPDITATISAKLNQPAKM
jgi:hypothetical protein